MKKLFLFALLCAGTAAQAQYFKSLYGDPTPSMFNYTYGVNTRGPLSWGHLLTSTMNAIGPNPPGALVCRTDVAGTPYFNNIYTIIKSGQNLGNTENHVFEWDNAPNIGVVGLLKIHNNEGIYYLQLDQWGNPFGVFQYIVNPATPFPIYVKTVTNIAESADGNYLYITGLAAQPFVVNGTSESYVMKIDIATGNLVWSHIYDFASSPGGGSKEFPRDLIESPYQPFGTMEVVVVGEYKDIVPGMASTEEGFLIHLDANTGMPLSGVLKYNSPYDFSDDILTAITVSNSSAGGGPGFILAGISTESHLHSDAQDIWAMKVDPMGATVMWQRLLSTVVPFGDADDCNDVIERRSNTTSQLEYYFVGSAGAGNRDVLVIKTDDMGIPFPNGLFRYNNSGLANGYRIDHFEDANVASAVGLTIYGNDYDLSGGTGNAMMLTTYFNGVQGCGEIIQNAAVYKGPGFSTFIPFGPIADLVPTGSLPVLVRPTVDNMLCFNMSDPSGDNSLKAKVKPEDRQALISPNPMAQGAVTANIDLEADEPGDVKVTIYDMMGRLYYEGSHQLVQGANQLPVNISQAMAAGMYTVKITGANLNKNISLIVR